MNSNAYPTILGQVIDIHQPFGCESFYLKLEKSIAYFVKGCQGQKIEFKVMLSNDID